MKLYDDATYQQTFEDLLVRLHLTPTQLLRKMLRSFLSTYQRELMSDHLQRSSHGGRPTTQLELDILATKLLEGEADASNYADQLELYRDPIYREYEGRVVSWIWTVLGQEAQSEQMLQHVNTFVPRLNSKRFLVFVDNPRLRLHIPLDERVGIVNSLLEFRQIGHFDTLMQRFIASQGPEIYKVGLAYTLFMEAWVTGCLPGQTPTGKGDHPLTVERREHWGRVLSSDSELQRFIQEEPQRLQDAKQAGR